MILFFCSPNPTTQRVSDDILAWAKLHSLEKYFGNKSFINRKLLPRLPLWVNPWGVEEVLVVTSPYVGPRGVRSAEVTTEASRLKIWIVPLSDETQIRVDSLLNAMEYISALSMPLRSSLRSWPVAVSNIRIRVPFSLAVAHFVPSKFIARQLNCPEWAAIILTLVVVDCIVLRALLLEDRTAVVELILFRSTTCIWPCWRPGKAKIACSWDGDIATKPGIDQRNSNF